MNKSQNRNHVLDLLNSKEPQHIPDIYFVKRSPKHLKKFLQMDNDNVTSMLQTVSPHVRLNYNLFKVSEEQARNIDKKIMSRNFIRKDDPFYLRTEYSRINHSVMKTNELLHMIDPLDTKRLKNTNKSQIRRASKLLFENICDKEVQFYGNMAKLKKD